MHVLAEISGWELILVFAVIFVLSRPDKLPELIRRLGEGVSGFRKAGREIDKAAHDAGESIGGVYGKPAAQALTPHNQVAELYDPAVFQDSNQRPKRTVNSLWRRPLRLIWSLLVN